MVEGGWEEAGMVARVGTGAAPVGMVAGGAGTADVESVGIDL